MSRASRLLSNASRAPELFRAVIGSPQWWALTRDYLRGHGRFPQTFRSRRGVTIPLQDWSELTTIWRVFFANEYHPPHDAKFIVDLGANLGAFALRSACSCPQAAILAVEAFPDTFDRLQTNVKKNDFELRIKCLHAAAAGVTGTVSFDARPQAHSYCRRIVTDSAAEAIEVPGMSLADILDEFSAETIDYLKVDIEGGEYNLFEAADNNTLRRCRRIGLEYHDITKADALWKRLADSGFERIRFRPDGWSGLAEFARC